MTEITDPGPVQSEGLISIDLVGCPNSTPSMMVSPNVVAEGKIRIPFGNGYDHFVFDYYTFRDGQQVPVFSWVDRTRIAE